MKKNNKKNSAKKAWVTIKARKAFQAKYATWTIVQDLYQGYTTKQVAKMNSVTIGTVAAVLANLNRENDFSALAKMCNW
jgi:transposase